PPRPRPLPTRRSSDLSSHVAASVVATGMALRYYRPLGLILLPLTVGLTLAVVYGQFHYGVDALSGLVVAGAMLATMQWGKAPAPDRKSTRLNSSHGST